MPDAANFCYEHPMGRILAWFSQRGLRSLWLPTPETARMRTPLLHSWVNDQRVWVLHKALDRYFAGARQDFREIQLDWEQGTEFQRLVWQGARGTKWGKTLSYGELATRIGRPRAARAVGQALGANPLPIIVPCHRFLAGDGSLGGFSAGLDWKRELLRVEGATQTDDC